MAHTGHDRPLNPECRAGKHDNCDGMTWCSTCHDLADCPCSCHTATHLDREAIRISTGR